MTHEELVNEVAKLRELVYRISNNTDQLQKALGKSVNALDLMASKIIDLYAQVNANKK